MGSADRAGLQSHVRWFGHVERLNDSRLPEKISNAGKDDIGGRGFELNRETENLALERVKWRRIIRSIAHMEVIYGL